MIEIATNIDFLLILVLFIAGVITFSISTISGGGGALMLIPLLNLIVGTTKTAPIINLGAFISRPSRIILFWKNIKVYLITLYLYRGLIKQKILNGKLKIDGKSIMYHLMNIRL